MDDKRDELQELLERAYYAQRLKSDNLRTVPVNGMDVQDLESILRGLPCRKSE